MKQVLWFSGSLVLGLAACTAPQATISRPPSYSSPRLFGGYGNPVDLEALVLEYPALKGRVCTAPEYIEEGLASLQRKVGKPTLEYRIAPGSTIDIEIIGEAELSQVGLVVPSDGRVEMPCVGVVEIAGLMRDELIEILESKYRAVLKRPQVLIHLRGGIAVSPADRESDPVDGTATVLWPDRSRESHGLTGGETLFGIVAPSDLTDRHDQRAIRVLRRADQDRFGRGRIIFVDAYEFVANGDVRQDLPLRPGDVVFIPNRYRIGCGFDSEGFSPSRQYVDGDIDLDALIDALDGR